MTNEYSLNAKDEERINDILLAMKENFEEKKKYGLRFDFSKKSLLPNVNDIFNSLIYNKRDIYIKNLFEVAMNKLDFVMKDFKETKSIQMSHNDLGTFERQIRLLKEEFVYLDDNIGILNDYKRKDKRNKEIDHYHQNTFKEEEIIKDILALRNEFEAMSFNRKTKMVYVTTKEIILNDGHDNFINLGQFIIGYNCAKPDLYIKVRAKKPIYHQNSKHYHPHVDKDGEVCFGESIDSIMRAHRENSIFEIFLTLYNLLTTYNAGSPYANLDTWIGSTCDHCGTNNRDSSMETCNICEDNVCPKCRNLYSENGEDAYICLTCSTEQKNQCPGSKNYPNHTCSNFINNTVQERCSICMAMDDLFELRQKEEKECVVCQKKIEEGETYKCQSCGKANFCSNCARLNTCEFCRKTYCPECSSVCSNCSTPTHKDCLTLINNNLLCPVCEKKVNE